MSFFSQFDARFWQSLFDNPLTILVNLLDVAIVAYLIYRFIKALAGTKIMSLVQGIILFIILKLLAEFIGLTTITYLMNQIITYGVIAGVVIFAPEIRLGLEKFGKTTQLFTPASSVLTDEEKLIDALVKSVAYMSPRKIGALISIQGTQTLREYINTGISLNADVSSQLLINTFIPNTPLHDGAVIIRGKKIAAACCYLPLTESTAISKEFGTRHRAAIGLSEHSDALTIVVSEETGSLSVTHNGRFQHDLSNDSFELILREILLSDAVKTRSWKERLFGKGEK
ncbi:diadenylate cyclase CdaA [Streptococcus pluranimalium]|uniref:diadenylate cyclase CdaA n=1 Tax=Streptococcus pluranimalium TaxID=82348 RepID=UPI001C4AEB91|nr:diadenylate cyclase CdaA [Streptococcus pluranimalium]MDY3041494.1 diadenylate cyclase CdaA [Streptococcus pluranimalium]WFM79021.1 diadenylate cyclase CdaA [Streptococcus pluranimalium]HEM6115509.1 TIGR00159 family protein [Streptococcus suis]